MKKMALYLPLLLAFGACGNRTETCVNVGITFRMTGFSRAEGDTVVIRKYDRATGLPAGDSVVYYSEGELAYRPDFSFDTLTTGFAYIDDRNISVSVPGTGKTVRITDVIIEPPHSVTRKGSLFAKSAYLDACYNRVISYKQDGVLVNQPSDEIGVLVDIRR